MNSKFIKSEDVIQQIFDETQANYIMIVSPNINAVCDKQTMSFKNFSGKIQYSIDDIEKDADSDELHNPIFTFAFKNLDHLLDMINHIHSLEIPYYKYLITQHK